MPAPRIKQHQGALSANAPARSDCTLTGQAARTAYTGVAAGIDAARLPFLADLAGPAHTWLASA